MWLKSHHWVDVPHTAYERKRVLNVRESKHTYMLFDKRHYDVETGKFNSDKLKTLNSELIADLVEDDYVPLMSRYEHHRRKSAAIAENEKWFVPKDDNFDEECRLDEEKKRTEEMARVRKEREDNFIKHQLMEIEKKKKRIEEEALKEKEYQLYVMKREVELKLQQQKRAQLAQKGTVYNCGVIKNCWIPK